MKVQPLDAVWQLCGHIAAADAKAAAGRAGVVDRMPFLCGVFRVDAQAHAGAAALPQRAVGFELREAIEADMVADRYELGHLGRCVSRAVNMVLAPGHLLVRKARLKQAAGGRPGQIAANERVGIKQRERFLRQQNVAARAPLHAGQDFEIAAQRQFVHHIDRRLQRRLGTVQAVHHSTVAGASSTTQGRP